MAGYSPAELDAIEGWLRARAPASRIAAFLSHDFRRNVSRNAVIGIIHRNKRLAAIAKESGWSRPKKHGGRKTPAPARHKEAGQAHDRPTMRPAAAHLHSGNIRGKREGRRLNPVFSPAIVTIDGRTYDSGTRALPLAQLRHAECRWPVNDAAPGEEHLFCAAATDGLGPYCPHHRRRSVGQGTAGERKAGRELVMQAREDRRVAARTMAMPARVR